MHPKRIVLISITMLLNLSDVHGGINLGLRVCNNHWYNHWLITASPELSFSGRWFWIGVDGTFGSHEPTGGQEGRIYQSRWSFIPMLKIPLIGPLFTAAGYGLSSTFRREELEDADGEHRIVTQDKKQGELRGFLGVEIPLSSRVRVYLKGGYAFIDKNNQYYSISVGTSLIWPKTTTPTREIPESLPVEEKSTPSLPHIKKVTILGTKDLIIGELNTAIEVAMSNSGIRVFNWKTIQESVEQHHDAQKKEIQEKGSDLSSSPPVGTLPPMDVALEAARLLKLDAIVKTQMRYTYETYGGEIIVNSAYVQIIQPDSGEMLWATEYLDSKHSFSQCKKKLSEYVIKALKYK